MGRAIFTFLIFSLFITACAGSPVVTATPVSTTLAASTSSPSSTPLPSETVTITPVPTNTPIPTETATASPTPIPTYVVLRGKVIPEQANCRYGPGAPYLYKYGLVGGSNLEIIARNPAATWVEIQAIGGSNPCWVKASLMEIKGDLQNVQPVDAAEVKLPPSPYYGPLSGVSAARNSSQVTVSWNALILRAGDSSEQTPYIVEAWVCQGGHMVFIPEGTYQTSATITDEPGCSEPSRARVIAAEKHGYTQPVPINWPPANP